jgi:plastocyanin
VLLAVPVRMALAADTTVSTTSARTFSPKSITIAPGDTVTWHNPGGTHSVVFDDGSYTSGDPSSDATLGSHTFNTAGTYAYHCAVHGAAGGIGMSGTVVVGSGPEPEPTLTPTPTPTATPIAVPGLSHLIVRRAVTGGSLHGSVKASPAGSGVTVRVHYRGDTIGHKTLSATASRTKFAVHLSGAFRHTLALVGHRRVKVGVQLGTIKKHLSVLLHQG